MLEVTGLRKVYRTPSGEAVVAVKDLTLRVPTGKMFTLVGPSGCGKTTTLRSIAGLERPDAGRMRIGDVVVFDGQARTFVPPYRRQLGMVFQSYAIWPHMTVFENVAFPLRMPGKKLSKAQVEELVLKALDTMQMQNLAGRSATQLSGGQQQRLALARAIVGSPKLLLLDEPLSNLDAKLRESMRFELKRLQFELGITTIYVTHDQTEALALSDDIAVMNLGEVVQHGTPDEIYYQPRTEFVANFIGSTNLLAGRVVETTAEGVVVDTDAGDRLVGRAREPVADGTRVSMSIRPETVLLGEAQPGVNRLRGTVKSRIFLGEATELLVDVAGRELKVRVVGSGPPVSMGDALEFSVLPEHCLVIPPEAQDVPAPSDLHSVG